MRFTLLQLIICMVLILGIALIVAAVYQPTAPQQAPPPAVPTIPFQNIKMK